MHTRPRPVLASPPAIASGSGALTLVASVLLGLPPPAHAATELQATTETAIRTVCPQLAGMQERTQLQDDLFFRCREMVQTRNALEDEGPQDFNLGLEEDALNAAFQQIAAEESVAPGTMVTEFSGIQSTAVLGRISALQGTGPGIADAGRRGPDSIDFPVLLAQAGDGLALGVASDPTNSTDRWGQLGVFANGSFGFGDRDATAREDGFDFDTIGLTAGADYRLTPGQVLGAALGYSRLEADFHRSTEVAGGNVEGDSWSLLGYWLYHVDDFFVHALAGHSWTQFDIKRHIVYEPGPDASEEAEGADRTAKADPDGRQLQASVGSGYGLRWDAWTLTPGVRLEYLRARVNGYRESGAEGLDLEVQRQTIESFTSALGAQISYAWGQPFGVLIPQARAEWIHEFSNSGRRIETRYVNDPNRNVLAVQSDDPDRDYLRLGLGISAVLRAHAQGYLEYETLQGLSNIDSHQITAGMRLEF